jgi:hypothetical protein
MNASASAHRLHDVERPYAEFEVDDYEKLKSIKARLDKARLEVEKRYEALSKCHLDNMTYAKAQLDHARQKEKDCFGDFERVLNELVTIISRLVRAKNSAGTHNADEVEDDTDISSLGSRPRLTPRRIRAPTRADVGPSRRASRHIRTRATGPVPVPGSTTLSSNPVAQALATRAINDASVKTLIRVVATANATQSQFSALQKIIDEVTVELNGGIAQPASQEFIKQESESDS